MPLTDNGAFIPRPVRPLTRNPSFTVTEPFRVVNSLKRKFYFIVSLDGSIAVIFTPRYGRNEWLRMREVFPRIEGPFESMEEAGTRAKDLGIKEGRVIREECLAKKLYYAAYKKSSDMETRTF